MNFRLTFGICSIVSVGEGCPGAEREGGEGRWGSRFIYYFI
jgi:hypothetical protein